MKFRYKTQEGFPMIYVSKEQAAHVKYLLEQAMQGNHIMFEPGAIRRVLTRVPTNHLHTLSRDELDRDYDVKSHIEKVMAMQTIPAKKAYLERLPADTFEAVVRTYVSIVENTLKVVQDVKH